MKKKVLFLIIFLTIQYTYSQKDIETTIITIDLASPKSNSVINSDKINKLVVKNKNPLAFKLVNGNPFRYRYALNFKKLIYLQMKHFKFLQKI